jgi:ribosomal protein S18 acetylase RimI-like enzyme
MMGIRPPAASESAIVSELILQSDCGLLMALFGATVRSLLCHLQSKTLNPYSTESILVISDDSSEDTVIGALVGSRADAARRWSLHTASLLLGWYGPPVVARFPRLMRAGATLQSLQPTDFYLSHIAVLPEHRGRGAGAKLLGAEEENARHQGALQLVLDVEEHNTRARSFYARLDYCASSVIRIDLGRRGAFSFLRLCKGL